MNRKGLTLIEILVVLGIIGTLAIFALPTYYNFSAQLTLNAAARALAAELRGLQGQAVLQHKTLRLDLAGRRFPSGIKPVKLSEIGFSSSGFTPPGGSGTLILANRFGRQKKIIVSSAGRVRIE
ncbi:type IV pilin protein [Candidatus Margulisiibacteriota bacterium]